MLDSVSSLTGNISVASRIGLRIVGMELYWNREWRNIALFYSYGWFVIGLRLYQIWNYVPFPIPVSVGVQRKTR